jgi:hypothetical protein
MAGWAHGYAGRHYFFSLITEMTIAVSTMRHRVPTITPTHTHQDMINPPQRFPVVGPDFVADVEVQPFDFSAGNGC